MRGMIGARQHASDVVGRIWRGCEQFVAEARERRRVVHVVPCGQQGDIKVDLGGALDGLREHARGTPLDVIEQSPVRGLESDQVITAIVRCAEYNTVAGAR